MKLHRIQVENLNSLYGTHSVDLDRDLDGASLFLIQGPTGAGKSTLMDAISLALFGTTPRMQGERSDRTIAEQVMSRETGSCSAELEFSKLSGEYGVRARYRARWVARRAREHADGKMQATERSLELLRDGDWQTLASDKREKVYGPEFEKVLEGFSQQDFQRSMLLAQGQFDAMLHATPEERASILERLTNTDQYRTIGARAAAIRKAWRGRLQALEAKMEAVGVVDVSARAELKKRSAELTADRDQYRLAEKDLEALRDWRQMETQLKAELTTAATSRVEKATDWDGLEPQRQKLEEFTKARPALERKREFDGIGHALEETQVHLGEAEKGLPALRETAQNCVAALAQAEARHQQASGELQNLRAPVREVRKAIQTQGGAEGDLTRTTRELGEAATHLTEAREAAKDGTDQLRVEVVALRSTGAEGHLREMSDSLRARTENQLETLIVGEGGDGTDGADGAQGTDAAPGASVARFESVIDWVKGEVSQFEQQAQILDAHLPRLQALSNAANELSRIEIRIATFEEQLAEHRRQLAELAPQIQAAGQEQAAALVAYTPLRRQMEFIEQRAFLQSDEACPLCGSLEHPWSGVESESLEAEATAAREREELATQACRELGNRRATLTGSAENVEASIASDREVQLELKAKLEQLEDAVRRAVADTEWSTVMDADAAAEALRTVRSDLVRISELKTELIRMREKAGGLITMRACVARLENAKARSTQSAAEAQRLEQTARDLLAQNRQLLAEAWAAAIANDDEDQSRPATDADPDALERSQESWVRALEERARESRTRWDKAKDAVVQTTSAIEINTKSLNKLKKGHAAAEEDLKHHLELLGLDSNEALESRRLTPDQEQTLTNSIIPAKKALDQADQSAEDLTKRVAAHAGSRPEHALIEAADDELTQAITLAAAEVQKAQEELNGVAAQLIALRMAEEKAAQILGAYKAAIDQSRVWERVHGLIGVRDGEQFKEFAQALNLSQLLAKANQHLSRLHDRYRLGQIWREVETDGEENVRVPTLEFEIEDQWRPGSCRSLKTLSGGESFLVSLALALGLSDLRTTSMPIETLLLDEGFGTLDPETLDVALGALQQLQASGRQVGLISHVVGLEERIDARILVQPTGNGRSKVTATVRRGVA